MKRTTIATLVVVGVAAAAQAEPTFWATTNNTLYRFTTTGSVDTFTLSDKMMSLAIDSTGAIVGHSAEKNSGQLWESYQLMDPTGTPSLSLLSDQVAGPRPTLSFDNTGTGFSTREDGSNITQLITVNSDLTDNALIGSTGLGRGTNGSGYDPTNDTLYAINNTTDSLYSVNRTDGSVTNIGSLGLDYFNGGAEFVDGTLYAFIQDVSREMFVFGAIDTNTGAFTTIRDIASYDPTITYFSGLTGVVPAPGSLALLGLGGLVASRRRR